MINFTQNYFKPLDQISHCNLKDVANPVSLLVIASYFTLLVPAVIFALSCFKGRVKIEPPPESPKVDKVAKDALNKPKAENLFSEALKVDESDPAKAMELFKQAADHGSIEAHFELGFHYATGKGSDKNNELAIKHYIIASEAGMGVASSNLGLIYDFEMKDKQKAVIYYQKAIDQKFYKTIDCLAYCYENGLGVEKNEKRAFELVSNYSLFDETLTVLRGVYYKKGIGCDKNLEFARQNFSQYPNNYLSLYHLGNMYLKGNGVPIDQKKGYELVISSYNKNPDHLPTLKKLSILYMRGIGTERDLAKAKEILEKGKTSFPDENLDGYFEELDLWGKLEKENDPETLVKIADDIDSSLSWLELHYYKKAADMGHAIAQYFTGGCYEKFNNHEKAKHYYRLAAEQGEVDSMVELANLDDENSIKWLQKAVEKNCVEALYNLGVRYLEGDGCLKDPASAFNLLTKAHDLNDSDATARLGYMYMHGIGTQLDYDKAFQLLSSAIEDTTIDRIYARHYLSYLYMRGQGTQRDLKKVKELLEGLRIHQNYQSEFEGWEAFENENDPAKLMEVAINLKNINFNLWKNLVLKAADLGHADAQNIKKSFDT